MKNKQALCILYRIYDMNEEYGNEKEALKWLNTLVKIDDSYQVRIAKRLLDGINCKYCEQNDKQAFDILQKASQSGKKQQFINWHSCIKMGVDVI